MQAQQAPIEGHRGWQRGCVVLFTALVFSMAVACPLGIVGIRRGVIAPGQIDQTLGSLRLVGYRTWNANCPPYSGCDPSLHESYVLWLVVRSPGSGQPISRAYRFLKLPIEH
jgi:hypothetical protein